MVTALAIWRTAEAHRPPSALDRWAVGSRALEAWTAAQQALHPRDKNGKFIHLGPRFIDAVDKWANSGKLGDPLAGFTRAQMVTVAKQRGIPSAGVPTTVLSAALRHDIYTKDILPTGVAHVQGTGGGPPLPAGVQVHPIPTTTRFSVRFNGARIGEIHPHRGSFMAMDSNGQYLHTSSGRSFRTFSTQNAAAIALVAHHGSPAPAAPPAPAPATTPAVALAKPTLKRLFVHPTGPVRESHAVSLQGTSIGRIEKSSTGTWFADPPVSNTRLGGFARRKDAVDALVTHYYGGLPPTPVAPPNRPPARMGGKEIAAALDVVYGADPKATTTARQLTVYGALRKGHFDSLDAAEQQTIIGDLAYIEKTSKSANGPAAKKLIDRFTPAGTPLGTFPAPSAQIVGPATGTQTRLPSPRSGLLQQAKNSGQRGDEWLSSPTGTGGRVWGRYGSGGILLRHVDANGVERYLMTQRGPAISDPGKWSYPGGAFESLEDPYQGATREVAEELGWTDADFAPAEVHGYHMFERPDILIAAQQGGGKVPWSYTSVAATVPTMLTPNLKTAHARAETSDAKWMTAAEIEQLDQKGMLHAPVAGGKLQQNVMSLFPPSAPKVSGRPARLAGPVPMLGAHKPSRGRNLVADAAAQDKLRADVAAVRKNFNGKAADPRLAAIGAMQGYDDTPTVVTRAEMDRLLATGDYIEAWRGVSSGGGKTAAQIHEEMRSGPAYYGTGVFGHGYYLATDKHVAEGYSDYTKNAMMRVLIPKSAKTRLHEDVRRDAAKTSTSGGRHTGSRTVKGIGTLQDPGRYAAASGLDGIEIQSGMHSGGLSASHVARPGRPAYNWLNRSVLIIQEAQ